MVGAICHGVNAVCRVGSEIAVLNCTSLTWADTMPLVRHFVYIVHCADGSLYTGYAKDVTARVAAHNRARGAKYTASRRPVTLVYSRWFMSVGAALKREYAIKQLPRAEKETLIGRKVRSKRR